ncbi:hypothetical protein HIM_08360 [Hirsutella minnesotensis 3608]|uniref:Uncharacterized protein n=1 Tax=Hirsutella minnesotensis 3608 TaxID=1043627 RepID=A0A0F7ZSZ4_9HYPO|nr:hypothetical protein HIM_08360 [Hirsutella minnesotensis 3608]
MNPATASVQTGAPATPSWLGTRQVDMGNFPSCAVPCITATCPDFDINCICGTGFHGIDEKRSQCIIDSCGFPVSLPARNLIATACGAPIRNQTPRFNIMLVILLGFTFLFILLRLVFKQFFSSRRRLGIDDWVIVVKSLVGLPCVAVLIFGLGANGLGKDVWTLKPDEVAAFSRYFYIMEMLYLVILTLVRLSVTLFYLEIFPSKTARRLLWGTAIFHVASGVAFVVKVVFQCWPISFNWTIYTEVHSQGHCVNISASSWANAGIGVAADLWLLAIPLFQLKKLDLHWKKKVGAALMFLAGATGTVVSILRLGSLHHFADTINPTWERYGIVWWSAIEVQAGMMCTCLPAARAILVHFWPHVFGTGFQPRSRGSTEPTSEPFSSQSRLEEGQGMVVGSRCNSMIGKTSTRDSSYPVSPINHQGIWQGLETAMPELKEEAQEESAETMEITIQLDDKDHRAHI